MIGFERLRNYIRNDLCLANFEIFTMERVMDKDALWLFEGTGYTSMDTRPLESYDGWTESEVAMTRERIFNRISKSDTEFLGRQISSKHIQFKSRSMLELFGSSPELRKKTAIPDIPYRFAIPSSPKSILVRSDDTATSKEEYFREFSRDTSANKDRSSSRPCRRGSICHGEYSGTSTPTKWGTDDESCNPPVTEVNTKSYETKIRQETDDDVCSSCDPCPYHICNQNQKSKKFPLTSQNISDEETDYEFDETLSSSDETVCDFSEKKQLKPDFISKSDARSSQRKSSFQAQTMVDSLDPPIMQDSLWRNKRSTAAISDYEEVVSILEEQLDNDDHEIKTKNLYAPQYNKYQGPGRSSVAVEAKQADAAESSRPVLAKVSEDTIEETILVKDPDAQAST